MNRKCHTRVPAAAFGDEPQRNEKEQAKFATTGQGSLQQDEFREKRQSGKILLFSSTYPVYVSAQFLALKAIMVANPVHGEFERDHMIVGIPFSVVPVACLHSYPETLGF